MYYLYFCPRAVVSCVICTSVLELWCRVLSVHSPRAVVSCVICTLVLELWCHVLSVLLS